jgi:hypothetical protein
LSQIEGGNLSGGVAMTVFAVISRRYRISRYSTSRIVSLAMFFAATEKPFLEKK